MLDAIDSVLDGAAGRVVLSVVGQHGLDSDRVLGEELSGVVPEHRAGGALLVAEDLAVDETAVRVDRGVDVVVTDLRSRLPQQVLAAMGSPTTTRWDPPELLH